MQDTVRTTIRIRKDLLDQSRLLAFQRDKSLQDVINETLMLGFRHITNLSLHKEAMRGIDKFRESLKDKKIDAKKILWQSKKDLK